MQCEIQVSLWYVSCQWIKLCIVRWTEEWMTVVMETFFCVRTFSSSWWKRIHYSLMNVSFYSLEESLFRRGSKGGWFFFFFFFSPPTVENLVGTHDAPIRCVEYCPEVNVMVTGSWDQTVKLWDPRTPCNAGTFSQPEKVGSFHS